MFPFIRLLFFFISGILLSYYNDLSYGLIWKLFGISFIIYGFITVQCIYKINFLYYQHWLRAIGLLMIFFAGALNMLNHQQIICNTCPINDDLKAYIAVALEEALINEKGQSVTIQLKKGLNGNGKWIPQDQLVQLKIKKDISFPPIAYGDQLLVLGSPQVIRPPMNPHAFDYQSFLDHSHIRYQHILWKPAVSKIGKEQLNYFQTWAVQVRRFCFKKLSQALTTIQERGIVLALLLGIKKEITPVLQSAYAVSGTMHVLAVSGLHIGLLYSILYFILFYKRTIKHTISLVCLAIVMLICLWFYAGITGFSPSVIRASAMCSLILLAKILKKKVNIYNILSVVAFFMLLWDPFWLFSISFQLSFIAVVGIVYLQPKIFGCLKYKLHWLPSLLWQWTSVSLAAQLATFPLSLYYFHQFPLYFIFANWVVIPATFCIFIIGIVTLATSFIPPLYILLGTCLRWVTQLTNDFVLSVSCLPGSALTGIHLSSPTIWLTYGILLCMLAGLKTRKIRYFFLMCIQVVYLSITAVIWQSKHLLQKGIVFYHIPHHQAISWISGQNSYLLVDKALMADTTYYAYHIKNHQDYKAVKTNIVAWENISNQRNLASHYVNWHGFHIICWSGKFFLFTTKESQQDYLHAFKQFPIDFFVITHNDNAISHLKTVCQLKNGKNIIIANSVSPKIALQLAQEAQKWSMPCHNLQKAGALEIYW